MGYRPTRTADPLGCEYAREEHSQSKASSVAVVSYFVCLSISSRALRPISAKAPIQPRL